MGNWSVTIQGVCVHHNTRTNPDGSVHVLKSDANIMAAEFVKLLKERGHTVTHSSFISGMNESSFEDTEAYLKNYAPEQPKHYPPGMGEESRRLHREYNALVAAQNAGAKNGPEVVRLTDECAEKGIILVPGGEHL